jgi:hypothetical protein
MAITVTVYAAPGARDATVQVVRSLVEGHVRLFDTPLSVTVYVTEVVYIAGRTTTMSTLELSSPVGLGVMLSMKGMLQGVGEDMDESSCVPVWVDVHALIVGKMRANERVTRSGEEVVVTRVPSNSKNNITYGYI